MIIVVDLDDVLVEFLPKVILYHNETYGTNFKINDFFSYHFWEVWGGTREEAIQKVYDFHSTPHFKNLPLIEGAKQAIFELAKNNDLFVVTSRQHDILGETENVLDKNFGGCFKGLYLTNQFSKNGVSNSKREFCDLLDADVLIEDSLTYALECLKIGRKIFLLDKPWNQTKFLPNGIIRVNSWKEILEKI